MNNKSLWAICPILLLCFCFAQCKKPKATVKTELEKLPPITQTGANTLGCLLNGQAWIPKDNYGQATFKLDVDPTFGNGIFVVSAVRYEENSNSTSLAIGSVKCMNAGAYNLIFSGQVFSYSNTKLLCSYDNNSTEVYKSGLLQSQDMI